MINQEELLEKMTLICQKTMSEKFEIPDVDFNFFGIEKGKGMYVLDEYVDAAEKYEHIDMMYDLFEWQNGVGYYCILEAADTIKDKQYIQFVREWVDHHIEKGLPEPSVNSTVPFLSIMKLHQTYGDKRYWSMCEERAAYCMARAPRAEEGAFEHTVLEEAHKFTGQVWADTMFMAGLFLAYWGLYSNNDMYVHEAVRQFLLHYKYLKDEETGLLYHGYDSMSRTHLSAVRWGRANGWPLIAGAIMLTILPNEFPGKSDIEEAYLAHLEAVMRYQNQDGSFHTVLDEHGTYKESTVTSAVVFGVSRMMRLDLIDHRYSDNLSRGIKYLISMVDDRGIVKGTSGGTPIMRSVSEYNKIPCVMSYYGQGMAVLGINEYISLLNDNK